MFSIGDLYRKAIKIDENEIEYEYFNIIDWWEENNFKYVRIKSRKTNINYDINIELMKYMEKVI